MHNNVGCCVVACKKKLSAPFTLRSRCCSAVFKHWNTAGGVPLPVPIPAVVQPSGSEAYFTDEDMLTPPMTNAHGCVGPGRNHLLLMINCVEHCDRVSMQQDTGEVQSFMFFNVLCEDAAFRGWASFFAGLSMVFFAGQAMLAQAAHLSGLYRPGFDFVLQQPVSVSRFGQAEDGTFANTVWDSTRALASR